MDLAGRTCKSSSSLKGAKKGQSTIMLSHWPIFRLMGSTKVECHPGLLAFGTREVVFIRTVSTCVVMPVPPVLPPPSLLPLHRLCLLTRTTLVCTVLCNSTPLTTDSLALPQFS